MILHLNKEKVDNLDLDIIGNEFVERNEHRLKYFEKFKWSWVMHYYNNNLLF